MVVRHIDKMLRHDYNYGTFNLDVVTIERGVGERNWDVTGSPIKDLPNEEADFQR